jgi:ABC-2 type transport system ATP-binding protein
MRKVAHNKVRTRQRNGWVLRKEIMVLPYYYVIAIAVAIFFVGLYLLLDKFVKNEKAKPWVLRGLALLFTVIFICRYLSAHPKIKSTIGLNIFSPFGIEGQTETVFCLFMFWLTVASVVLLQTYPFYKDKVFILKHLVKFFATTVYLINFGSFSLQMVGYYGTEALDTFSMGSVFLAVETGVALALCVAVWIKEYRTPFSWKGFGCYVGCVVGMIFVSIPCFALQLLVGKGPGSFVVSDFNLAHRLSLYANVVFLAAGILLFYNKDYDHKRYALLYISLAICISYTASYEFRDLGYFRNYPLHLCNTAVYMIPFCLIFKVRRFYYFTFFVNVFGAAMAMLMPNMASQDFIFTYSNVRFWINHFDAFCMPILIMVFGLYERPKMKEMGYSLIAFTGYFLLVLFVNAYYTSKGVETDFFFINSDFIASKFGQGAKNVRLATAEIPTSWGTPMVFYPPYQIIFYSVYVGVSFFMWYVYLVAFQIQDSLDDLFKKNRKYKSDMQILEESLKGRNKNEPMDEAATNKLILNNFCKKYSTSNVYAVKDANLEIEGGQIFGFLGPNGAGKSTIIKSIVGIQTITSGSIEVCGFDAEKQSVQAKMQIGFVPDHYALYENLSGREYINYIANLYGVSIEDRNKRIDEFVERFQLQGSFENPIKTYSHGMKQKITIMSALVHNPKVWILDEPLTGLDPDSIFQVKETMKQHAAAGNIVFFSSHIIDVVEKICDKIAIIKNGHIICTADVKEIEESGVQLENFYRTTIESSTAVREIDESSILPAKDKKEKKESKLKKLFRKKSIVNAGDDAAAAAEQAGENPFANDDATNVGDDSIAAIEQTEPIEEKVEESAQGVAEELEQETAEETAKEETPSTTAKKKTNKKSK